jgi:hypothetical protein
MDSRMQAADTASDIPRPRSFKEFLLKHARVKADGGSAPYTFEGRAALEAIIDRIDEILGNPLLDGTTRKALRDAQLAVCGGAQWGKTTIGLLFTAYMTGCKFRAVGYYLPDDNLVQGVVDGKLRPEVIDIMPWYARMITVGKTLNASGRAVNRKGAFTVTDGKSTGLGMIRGMGKIPTTFSMDVTVQDEKDDINVKRAKFLKGRLTNSKLRFSLIIGTQRIAGASQNAEFEAGTQEVFELIDPVDGSKWCPEEHWPQICRVAVDGKPSPDDPQLTELGDFRAPGEKQSSWAWDPEAHFYLANPKTGAPLDRDVGAWTIRRPDRIIERKFSMRISQMGIAAIELVQIVSHWRDAVTDPEQMIAFSCDRLAIPKSTLQQLDQAIINRARETAPFRLSQAPAAGFPRFGGLDTGDRCWFTSREVESPFIKRINYAEQIALGNVKARAVDLYHRLGLSCIFIDARPAADEARHITWAIHGLLDFTWPKIAEPESQRIAFGNDLVWDGPNSKWLGLHAAVVEFALREGQGIRHKLGITQDGKFYPVIQCNRDESIQGVIHDLLTPKEGIVQVIGGVKREVPSLLLPMKEAGAPVAVEMLGNHFLTGSKRVRSKDGGSESYVDHVENHFLLGATYARLAEMLGGSAGKAVPFAYQPVRQQGRAGKRTNARSRTAVV